MNTPASLGASKPPYQPGRWAAKLAHWLSLAAAPCLALLALQCMASDEAGMLCGPGRDAVQFGGMATMYLAMCAFHVPAWLRSPGTSLH
jgi:hypothetical protein